MLVNGLNVKIFASLTWYGMMQFEEVLLIKLERQLKWCSSVDWVKKG